MSATNTYIHFVDRRIFGAGHIVRRCLCYVSVAVQSSIFDSKHSVLQPKPSDVDSLQSEGLKTQATAVRSAVPRCRLCLPAPRLVDDNGFPLSAREWKGCFFLQICGTRGARFLAADHGPAGLSKTNMLPAALLLELRRWCARSPTVLICRNAFTSLYARVRMYIRPCIFLLSALTS